MNTRMTPGTTPDAAPDSAPDTTATAAPTGPAAGEPVGSTTLRGEAGLLAAAQQLGRLAARPCARCGATGAPSAEDRRFGARVCPRCDGVAHFPAPDGVAILRAILSSRGRSRAALRTSAPANRSRAECRAYFVWRLARFHGGVDVSMPALAATLVSGDPFVTELHAFAEAVARVTCGTDLAAAFRWFGALHGDAPLPAGLPATAYPAGPVVLGDKPEAEALELV